MIELTLPAMTCGHCKSTVTRALLALDGAATLQFDVPAHKVTIASSQPLATLKSALEQAGYPVAAAKEVKDADCCGHCQA